MKRLSPFVLASLVALALAPAACGPSSSSGGETTPTLPGDDPIGDARPAPEKKPAGGKKPTEPDPWAGKKDLIQPPAARAPATVALPAIERFQLANGLRVIVVENRALPVVSFHLAVKAGQGDEPREKRGLADFAAAMLTKGTKTRKAEQIAETIDQVGGSISAGVDLEATHVRCDILSKNVGTCLDLLPDLVANPSFAAADLEIIRKQITGAVRQRRLDPTQLGEDHFDNGVWGEDHVRGWPVTLDTILAVGRQDLVEWHASRFRPSNAVLVIAGDVDAKGARARIEKSFAGWKKADAPEAKKFAPPTLKGRQVRLVDRPDAPQAFVRVGHLGVAHAEPDYLAAALVTYTLGGHAGSRLAKTLEASGRVFQARAQLERQGQRGVFQAQVVARHEDAGAALTGLLGEIARMQKEGPSDAELAAAKANLAGSYPLGFESASSIASAVLAAELHGLGEDYVREFPVRVAAVSPGDARAAAKKLLSASDLVVVVVGNADVIAPQLKKAGIAFDAVDGAAPVSRRDREAAVAARQAPPDPKKAAEGKKLLDQAIAARGGEKKLAGITSLRATGKVTIRPPQGQTIVGEYVRYFGAPDQQRTDLSLPGRGTVKLVVSPKSAWVEFQNKVQDIPADALAAINVLLFVDPERVLLRGREPGYVVQAQGRQGVEGTDYDAVLVRSGDGKYEVTILLDVKTHLPYRVLYSVQGETLFDEYGEWKAVGGVQFAHLVKTVNLLLQVPVEIRYEAVEVNAGVPAGSFDRPK